MISAILEYRDYVSSLTFAHIKFNGNKEVTQLLNKLCDLISSERNNEQNAKINCLKRKQQANNLKIEYLKNEVLKLQNRYLISIFNKEIRTKIKAMKNEVIELIMANNNMDHAINTYNYYKNYDDVDELKNKYKDLLAELKFSCKTSYYKDHNDINVAIYEYCGDEKKLVQKVQTLIDKIITKLKHETNVIEQKFEALDKEQFSKIDIFYL